MIETPYNLDYSKEVIISLEESKFKESPNPLVHRIYLEREAPESGIATSFVRYLPNSQFKKHFHPGGEEIFVLDGVFSDENGDYPAGTYFRNPQGTYHTPSSKNGCLLFVKLCQFRERDNTQLSIAPTKTELLHSYKNEETSYLKVDREEILLLEGHSTEILLIKGVINYGVSSYEGIHWFRFPKDNKSLLTIKENSIILIKRNHF